MIISDKLARWMGYFSIALFVCVFVIFIWRVISEGSNKVSLMGSDFKVTFVEGTYVKSWLVEGGKVTSALDKGYYYFWAIVKGKERYIQTPIARTIIEEVDLKEDSET